MRFPVEVADCGWPVLAVSEAPESMIDEKSDAVTGPEPGSGDTSHFALPS